MQLSLIYLVLVAHLVASTQLPSDVEKCRYHDDNCILRSGNWVIQRYGKTGVAQMNIEPVDAIKVPPYELQKGNRDQPFWHDWKVIDQWVYGFENTTLTKIQGFDRDPRRSQVEIHGRVPSVSSTARFQFNSKFLTLKLNATGGGKTDFQNFRFIAKFSLTVDNKGYAKIYKLSLSLGLDRWIQMLDDLFVGNTDLSVIANEWINVNWHEYWVDIEPDITEFTRRFLIKKLNRVFSTVLYKDFFL
ncbi:protein takeout [Drosophila suzukii]|uniref:Protein takeout n=1 Tax=Drosophila suzukii TaxID=28584 RepID=A0AB39ZRF3_DROSZ